jgi:hypothetical protein
MGAGQQALIAIDEGVAPPPVSSDFAYWFDGQPLVGQVEGNFDYWNSGQPVVQEDT